MRRAGPFCSGAGPTPTATMRSPSMTRWPSRCSVFAASTVAIAQPSMTVRSVMPRAPRRGGRRPSPRCPHAGSRRALLGEAVGGQADRVEDLLVPGAAAQVAGQRLADLGIGRARIAVEQVVAGDDEPGRAEAALDAAGLDERTLDLVEAIVAVAVRDALDADHLALLGLAGEHEAGAHECA